ncbi:MAG: DUF3187 family protein [Deltaproteobacteria bacterium]
MAQTKEHGVSTHSAARSPGIVVRAARSSAVAGALLLALAGPPLVVAQGLPEYAPVNPVAQSRSGLYFQPYSEPAPKRLRLDVRLDYGNAIEYDLPQVRPSYLLDGEFLRFQIAAVRDLRPNLFLLGEASLEGAYAGFLDGFINWYHHLWGFRLPERDARPNNAFSYRLSLANGTTLFRSPSDLFLGDLRLGAGYRWMPGLQTALSVTLPTATGPDGYGRGTVSLNAVSTARVRLAPPLTYEGSLGFGWTPTHGVLTPYQKEVFVSATSGLRFRFWGRQSLFANLFYHSPYYHGTTLPALDRRDLELDFGWLLATRSGREWRIGMTEDLEPSGPAIDIIFRLGASF